MAGITLLLQISTAAAELPYDYTKHTVVPDNYTAIYTFDDLNIVDLDGNYILMNDIDCSGEDFSPIGSSDTPFTGVFNGNGFSLSNLNLVAVNDYTAMFAACSGATIKNLIIENATADVLSETNANSYVACIAAYISDQTQINNCYVSGNLTSDATGISYVGGVAAYVDASNISNCSSFVNANGISRENGISEIGGVAGIIIGDSQVLSSSFDGSVTGNATTVNAGGIVGSSKRGTVNNAPLPEIINCVNNADLTISITRGTVSVNLGAIIGDAQNTYIAYCTNNGDITSTATLGAYAGGIAAQHARNTIEMSVNHGNISASSTAYDAMSGGIVASATYGYYIDSYNTGDIYVSGVTSAMSGGIVGQSKYSNNYNSCYSVGAITSEIGSNSGTYVGTTSAHDNYVNSYTLESNTHPTIGYTYLSFEIEALSEEQMKSQASFAGFDFENVWTMPTDGEYIYPILNGYKSALYGDVNSDGAVDVTDYTILARYYANWNDYKDIIIPETCDLNLDSRINTFDILILGRHLADFYGYSALPIDY